MRREAILLAGGMGSRLASVLPNQQKVTARVGDSPFALRLVRWLAKAGVERVVLAAGNRAEDVRALIGMRADGDPELAVSEEPFPLGTGGAARLAAAATSADPILVLNGDSFADIDVPALYRFHREREAAVSLALVPVPEPGRYGLVHTRPDGEVMSFEEKPSATPMSGWINAGVYLFDREAIQAIPEGRAVSLEREIFPLLVGKGLFACRFEVRFIDIGTPQSLAAADRFFGVEG